MARQTKKKTVKATVNRKTYVLDTNVVLHDHDALFAFEENEVVLPMVVLEELDKHKTRQDEVGANARRVCRTLDELREGDHTLLSGVPLHNGGTLRIQKIEGSGLKALPAELSLDKNDHLILACVAELHAVDPLTTILVSKDINIRVKCDALGLVCQDYRKSKVANSLEEMYSGVAQVSLPDEKLAELTSGRHLVPADQFGSFAPNQILVVKSDTGHGAATIRKCVVKDNKKVLTPLRDFSSVFGLTPRNKEQGFALDLLFDDSVKLVTLSGKAGCGKSLIALAAGLEQLKTLGSDGKYDKFIVMRPIQPVGKEIGFLPGSFEEKMAPWIVAIDDNLNFLMGTKRTQRRSKTKTEAAGDTDDTYAKMVKDKGLIEIAAITFMRGRSIPNAFILIDEAQNLSTHELKTLITRAGDGTKIVLTGDIQQIDNPHVDTFTNGLSYCIEKFKDQPIAGHVTFLKGERSELATIAANIL